MKTTIILSALISILWYCDIIPTEVAIAACGALLCYKLAEYYRKQGGRFYDDYERSMMEPGYDLSKDQRLKMEGVCNKYSWSMIATCLFCAALVVAMINSFRGA